MRRGCVIPAAVSLAPVDVRRLARDERADLAAFLATLSPRQWQAPTLCARWRVHDVVAHVHWLSRQAGTKIRVEQA